VCSQSGYSRVFMGLFKVIAYILAFTIATTHTQLCLNLPLTVGLLCLFFRADRASRNGAAWLILNLLQSQVASIQCRRQLPPSCAVNAVRWWAVRSTNRARLLKKNFPPHEFLASYCSAQKPLGRSLSAVLYHVNLYVCTVDKWPKRGFLFGLKVVLFVYKLRRHSQYDYDRVGAVSMHS
jgi:hypothetical protein